MTTSQPESNYPISTLTVAELETLITNIVQKVLSQPNNQPEEDEQAQTTIEAKEFTYDTTVRPFSEIIFELASQIPEEELAKIPRDASYKLDEYLYGIAQDTE